jgi:hypothetical protein
MSHVRLIYVVVAVALVATHSASAQSIRPELRFGLGTFLSRDRGWNYAEQIEVFAGVAQNVGSFNVEAGGSFYKSFRNAIYPAVYPVPPRAFRDGLAARLHVRTPNARTSTLSAIVGAELFQNRTVGEARVTTAAGTAGVGLNFGSDRRGSLDLRYVRFAKPLGSSRGILPLTVSWRL